MSLRFCNSFKKEPAGRRKFDRNLAVTPYPVFRHQRLLCESVVKLDVVLLIGQCRVGPLIGPAA